MVVAEAKACAKIEFSEHEADDAGASDKEQNPLTEDVIVDKPTLFIVLALYRGERKKRLQGGLEATEKVFMNYERGAVCM